MVLSEKLLGELQKRLKTGNRRGVHLNAIPANSRYKFDLNRLSQIDKDLPDNFVKALLSELPLKFKISWKDTAPNANLLFAEEATQLGKITKAFENLINQTETIESEKGINTFGFGFPLIARRDRADNKLTVAPILIWSLRIKRARGLNTWEIIRNEDDPIYINEILINHLQSDAGIEIEQISNEMLDDGLITKEELVEICSKLIKTLNGTSPDDLEAVLNKKLDKITPIKDSAHYDKLTEGTYDSFIDFGGLFSIFEVQKQNIISDFSELMAQDEIAIALDDLEEHTFQPISSIETDPSQQSILHALESSRNILIQGPPGTGKSQTLTAVLINALENNKKTIVVCEKRTALEVLHNALIEKGLATHSVLIRDIVKDRKLAVDSVRDRVDNSDYKRTDYNYSIDSLENLTNKAKDLILNINKKHQKTSQELINSQSWTAVVGNYLAETKTFADEASLNLDKELFVFTSQELNSLLDIIQKGKVFYEKYLAINSSHFLNSSKLVGDNPFQVEQNINDDFAVYEKYLNQIKDTIASSHEHVTNTPKVESVFFRFASFFLKKNKLIIETHNDLRDKITHLITVIESKNWSNQKIVFNKINEAVLAVESLIRDKKSYFEAEKDPFLPEFQWFQFYNNLSETEKKTVDALKSKEHWKQSFLIFYLNALLLHASNADLPVNDFEHEELDKILNGVEKEQLKFIKDFWFSKQIEATKTFEKNNDGLSVSNLYLKKQGTKNIRLSLRQIVKKDMDLFTTFFPIILTSPDVASNLFKGMNGYFDIVMFDEASQLRIEDNLPAILKGKQVVIAGDEHQMPPSNYFSKVFDGTAEDEDDVEEEEIVIDKNNILLSCESLLDFGTELNFHKKHLDFHYRSKHPYLIDFSNYAFYQQRLKPLPNNFDYVPIKYIQVKGTFFEYTNDAEAEMVLSIIENNINRLPSGKYPTVGIATFNISQRNLIKSKILQRQQFPKYKDFNEKVQELEENGMFVKNLENIQGDERDVIILSTTYGLSKDGKFAQRFGPINHSKGYKLLNVIITRAKYKIYCCSSIPEQVFMNYKDYLVADGSNTKSGKGSFLAYLAYSKSVSESDENARTAVLKALAENTPENTSFDGQVESLESPFEEEVYQSLAAQLGTENLYPQLKFAGFRIDLVYDSKIAGVPKIAIECDGAKYHSSQEAYLHDSHRQKILEAHGFIFHRIWSTNWWRNASRETTNLVDFIKEIEATKKTFLKDYSKTADAFTDTIEEIETPVEEVNLFSANDVKKD